MKLSTPSTTGAVSLEFLIAFPPLWVFFLCVFQLVLVARADLLVRHAADAAARSAAVVLPDDPSRYQGEPEMSVSLARPSGTQTISSHEPSEKLATETDEPTSLLSRLSLEGRSRRETIALAAAVPLASLGSTFAMDREASVESAIGPRRMWDLMLSRHSGLDIGFPGAVEGRVTGPEVTVRVEYEYLCGVPLARHLVCDPGTRGRRVWELAHVATLLIHDAPYAYRDVGDS